MNSLNKFFITFITIFILTCQPTLAVLDIDTSVDSDIRRKYNPQKAENELLPPLPDKLKNEKKNKSGNNNTSTTTPKTISTPQNTNPPKQTTSNTQKIQKPKSLGQSITLKKGTKLTVRSCEKLYDEMRIGKKVYFKISKPIKTNSFYLPETTTFVASIVDAHPPQITGNGGLLVINVEQVVINGKKQDINARITKSNHKKVFLNNIKGKRTYMANVAQNTQPGKNFYKSMLKKSKRYAKKKSTMILTPITYVCGAAVYGVNIIGSPVFALFSHGKNLTIPADTQFEIQLLEDTTLYN